MKPMKLFVWATDAEDAFNKFNKIISDREEQSDELKASWFRLLTDTGSAVGYVLSESAEYVVFFGSFDAYTKVDIQEADDIKEYMDRSVQ